MGLTVEEWDEQAPPRSQPLSGAHRVNQRGWAPPTVPCQPFTASRETSLHHPAAHRCDFILQKGRSIPGSQPHPPQAHPAVPWGVTEPSPRWQRGGGPVPPFPLCDRSQARGTAAPCAARPRLICERQELAKEGSHVPGSPSEPRHRGEQTGRLQLLPLGNPSLPAASPNLPAPHKGQSRNLKVGRKDSCPLKKVQGWGQELFVSWVT